MSSSSYFHGRRGRGSRGFSTGRTYDGTRGNYVSGDSHIQSVREANLGFRRGQPGSFANQTGFQPVPFYPRPQGYQFRKHPPYPQRPQFRQPQPYTQNQGPPPYYHNQGFRPAQQVQPRWPKPLDYRNWEYAKPQPPPNCERFKVLSYNILADYLAINHRNKLYFHIPHRMLDWEWRKRNITFELGLWSADILCFQEVDRFEDLDEELKARGYNGIWKMRTGIPVDGCAIFWRASRFKLLHEESIEFDKLGLRDNVAQICVLEFVSQNNSENVDASSASLASPSKVIICNIHVLYNPRRGEIKLGQVRVLLEKAHSVSKFWNDAPVVLCGDYNCTPKSPLYNFLVEQKLDLSELDRDKVSGQASAEIRQPRSFNPNPGAQSSNYLIPNNLESSVENAPVMNSLPQPHYSETILDASDKSCTDLHCGGDNALPHNEVQRGRQHSVIGDHKDGSESVIPVARDGLNKGLSASDVEGSLPVEQFKNYKSTSPIATNPKEVYPDATVKGESEKVYAPSHSNPVSSGGDTKESKNSYSIIKEDDHITGLGFDTEFTSLVHEELHNLSLNEVGGDKMEGERTDEDDYTFLSALHDIDDPKEYDSFPQNSVLSELGSVVEDDLPPMLETEQPSEVEEITRYDPSSWSSMEIETATGKADCTLLEHPLKLTSTYSEVEVFSESRDSNGEPVFTSYNCCFLGTVDYIWRSRGLQTVRVLAPIPKHAVEWTRGFPTKKWGSDHIALVSELALVKDETNDDPGAH